MADIDAMMGRIQKLIDTAESYQRAGHAEAAGTYRAKAEQLMRDYRIEEESLVREAVSSGAPIWRQFDLGKYGAEFLDEMHSLFWHISIHCGVEYHLAYRGVILTADVVGYEIDVRLLEMVYASARLAFLARLSPEYDATETVAENIYRLRGAGIDRQTVAQKVFGQKGHAEGIRVGDIYRAEVARRGEVDAVSGRGFNAKTYRKAYADAFVGTIARRLRAARDAADSVGGSLVLPARAERVKEALYEKYPSERPMTAEQAKAFDEAHKDDKPVKYKGPTAAQRREHARLHGPAANRARVAGAAAAQTVDLVRETTPAPRAESAARPGIEG